MLGWEGVVMPYGWRPAGGEQGTNAQEPGAGAASSSPIPRPCLVETALTKDSSWVEKHTYIPNMGLECCQNAPRLTDPLLQGA